MNISRSTIRHHLRYLLKHNLVIIKADKKDKRLYANNQMGLRDKELIALLRKEIPFKIIMYFLYPGYCSRKELAKDLGVYKSTISFHLKKLLEAGVIRPIEVKDGKLISFQERKPVVVKKPVKREIFYMWNNQQMKRDVYRLIITHKQSMLDPSIIDSYYDLVKETDPRWNLKQIFGLNTIVDNIIECLEEIFPSPYYL
jgi:DNA-binding transcriptional ArsR family regulator